MADINYLDRIQNQFRNYSTKVFVVFLHHINGIIVRTLNHTLLIFCVYVQSSTLQFNFPCNTFQYIYQLYTQHIIQNCKLYTQRCRTIIFMKICQDMIKKYNSSLEVLHLLESNQGLFEELRQFNVIDPSLKYLLNSRNQRRILKLTLRCISLNECVMKTGNSDLADWLMIFSPFVLHKMSAHIDRSTIQDVACKLHFSLVLHH